MILLVLVSANAVLAQVKVLVIANYYPQDVQAKLMATAQFSQVDLWTTNLSPLLPYLRGYDAVLCYSGGDPLPNDLGTVLAQYVDGGGGVVLAFAALYHPDYGTDYVLNGDFNNSTYQALVPGSSSVGAGSELTLGAVAMPYHPIMQGVRTFDGGTLSFCTTSTTLAPGAYLVASWSDGTPLIVARERAGVTGNARRVDLNLYPPSDDIIIETGEPSGGYWNPTTDGAKIMANALVWVIGDSYDFSADVITNPSDQSLKPIGTPLIPAVQITNRSFALPRGLPAPASVTVRFQMTLHGERAPVYTHDTVLTGINLPGIRASKIIQFPSFTPPAGLYEDTAIILNLQPTVDQNITNDVATSEFAVTIPHNVLPLAFVDPLPNSYASAETPTPIIIDFRNIGGNNETNVPITAVIKDRTGAVVYRDTEYALNWLSGQVREVQFRNFALPPGPYTFYGITLLATDQQRSDDTISGPLVHVRYDYDAAAIGIVNPRPNEQKPYTLPWQPTALFQSHGAQDLFNVLARVQIRRCSDGALVFQADSTIDALNTDQNQQQFSFPSKQGPYDISKIPSGCYTMCAITLLPNDADRSNDTICTQFSVIDRLKGDYLVGVGQQFPSIHAAVDSLRFRGVGANVRLILTDNTYTENGMDSAASTFGALDFRGIRGLADTATVTWIPNAGVTPRITFTGTQPACFYFGDLFGGHMTFEGYNPVGAPIPDRLVPEPNKRGITIVNNLTAAGSVFDMEEGASNITLKDLILTNNRMFTNNNDAVVRIYNEQNRNLYLGIGAPNPIKDTIPIHNIRIENCELGSAKYGIWDHAIHTQFNIGKSTFVDWRNYNNVFTRNTVGTSTSPLSYAGIQFNNEQNLTISHNEISNVNGVLGGFPNVYGIDQPSVLQSDTGDVIGVWVDANRVHGLTASGIVYGIAFQQAATIYQVGIGGNAVHSVLPSVTLNRATNNMIFDLRGTAAYYPLTYTTSAATYSTDRDSIFNNSISTRNATINIFVAQTKHAFLWNNIIQNTGAGPYVNYSLQLPRPFTSAVSSDYNLFDLRGTNTFATVNEYDLNSGTLIQSRTFRRLNDWWTYTQQDLHSLAGDPLFASDSLHEPTALSYVESPASNNGAWLNTATQLHDFDGDLRLQGNQTPDIGADEFDGFQYSNDLAVLSITQPAGYSATSDTTSVTIENPLWITAQVKNLSSQAVFNVPVSATVEVAISGGPWTTIYTGSTSPMNFEVNETKSVTFKGPVITQAQAQTGVFRVTVTVPSDQNNANNAAQKVFRVLLKNNATLVSYTSATPFGLRNRDSVTAALRRLNIAYDTLDRKAYASQDVDYTPWWTLIWSGDSTKALDSIPPLVYPRVNNYPQTNFTAIWTDISATGTAFTLSNFTTGFKSIPLPFNFHYDGTTISAGTNIRVGATGAISLLNATPPASNRLANSANPGLLCFFSARIATGGDPYDNLNYYRVDGIAPNRVFTIELRNMHFPGSGGGGSTPGGLNPTDMQVKLYETSGTIEFIYHAHNNDFDGGQGLGITAGVGLNGLSTPSFVSNTYATGLTATPATDIRWQGSIQPPTIYGSGGLSFKETQDMERYLQAGQSYAKKSLIMAGQNIAFYNSFVQFNNSVTDSEFMKSYLHTVYRANSPVSGAYNGMIQGQQTDYWRFADHLNSISPDVVAPSFTTPTVGSEITGFAYAYLTHPATPSDSGAGTTYTNPKMNTVFYGFDWSDPTQTTPSELGGLTSGTTRILKGALDFITSHNGTILPVEFTDVTARRINGNGLISWATVHQSDIARFEVERQDEAGPGAAVGTLHAIADVSADTYAFTDAGIDPMKSYTYRIAAIDLSGAKTYSPEAEIDPDGSAGFLLGPSYPNPTNGSAVVTFTLPMDAPVRIDLTDAKGTIVRTAFTGRMTAGDHSVTLDAKDLASGTYFYALTSGDVRLTREMILVR